MIFKRNNLKTRRPTVTLVFFGDGSRGWKRASRRLFIQASISRQFQTIYMFNLKTIVKSATKKDRELIKKQKKGLGFWIWKPLVLLEAVKTSPQSKYILYLDAGCDINLSKNAITWWRKKIQTLEQGDFDGIVFESIFLERKYTKKSVLEYFENEMNYRTKDEENQIIASAFLFNQEYASRFASEWLNLCRHNNFSLLKDDWNSMANNKEVHRHDQSLFSLLAKHDIVKSKVKLLVVQESEILANENFPKSDSNKFLVVSRNRNYLPWIFRGNTIMHLIQFRRKLWAHGVKSKQKKGMEK